MAEWFKAAVLKTCQKKPGRAFSVASVGTVSAQFGMIRAGSARNWATIWATDTLTGIRYTERKLPSSSLPRLGPA